MSFHLLHTFLWMNVMVLVGSSFSYIVSFDFTSSFVTYKTTFSLPAPGLGPLRNSYQNKSL